jgi:DNA-directed RNA polymerase subunit E'/Rpb7
MLKWDEIFVKSVITEKVKLDPKNFHAGYMEHIHTTLKGKVEGKCSRHGYIKKDSLEILHVGLGEVEQHTFRGYVNFNVKCTVDLCNPVVGSVILGKVQNINSFGILCLCGYTEMTGGIPHHVNILEVIVPKQSIAIKSEIELDKVRIGDEVRIEISGKKFELNDTKISAIGKIVKISKAMPASDNDLVEVDDGADGDAYEDEFDEEDYDAKDGDGDEGDDDDAYDEELDGKEDEEASEQPPPPKQDEEEEEEEGGVEYEETKSDYDDDDFEIASGGDVSDYE